MLTNRNTKILIGSLILIILALLSGLIAIMIIYSINNSISCKDEYKLCKTKECISAANDILKNMNLSVDPCEDFNQFTCGAFIASRRIPDDQTVFDTFSLLENNLEYAVADALEKEIGDKEALATANSKKFYHSCLNESNNIIFFFN